MASPEGAYCIRMPPDIDALVRDPERPVGAALVLGAVVHHAARRDLLAFCLSLQGGHITSARDEGTAEVKGRAYVAWPYRSPDAALVNLAGAAVTAYLNAASAA